MGGEGGEAAAVERRPLAGCEGQGGGGALLGIHLLKHKSHRPVATPGHLEFLSLSWATGVGVVNVSFHSPPLEKNIVNVRNVMKLSKIHEIGYIINGETQVLFGSVTVKIRKFLQEKVKTKKNDGLWGRFEGSQWCPRPGESSPPSVTPALPWQLTRAQAIDTGRIGGGQTVKMAGHA